MLRADAPAGTVPTRGTGVSTCSPYELAALDELRAVAAGIYPPLLFEAGLGAALVELVRTTGADVALDVTEERSGPAAEGAAYFALADVLGAGPGPLAIGAHREGDTLVVRVTGAGPGRRRPRRRGRPARRRRRGGPRHDRREVPVRVALAEDGALFRQGLVMLLEAAGHEVVACEPGGDELLRALDGVTVDVVVLDIRMPPEPDGGLVTAERLRVSHPDVGLLFLSHYAESHYLVRILEIGTERIGYRLKEKVGSVDVLSDTLKRIADGEIVIEPGPREAARREAAERPRERRGGPVGARARRPEADGRGPGERRDRGRALRQRQGRGEAHREHLRQVRPAPRRDRQQPSGPGGADLPALAARDVTGAAVRALSVAVVVGACLLLAVAVGEVALGPAGPVLAPFAGVGLAAAVLAATGLVGPGRTAPGGGRSAVLAAATGGAGSLPALARVLREGTRAEHADVWLAGPDGLAAQVGPDREATLAALLARADVDHAHPVLDVSGSGDPGPGAAELRAVLTLGKPGRPVTAADRALVAEVADAAGLLVRGLARGERLRARVARADELARQTEESRRRLGHAREGERRRLVAELSEATTDRLAAFRRAVTDAGEVVDEGLGPDAGPDDRAEAAGLARHHLDVARERLEELLDRFRVIARGVHPAVLRDQGLRAALEEVVADLPRPVHLAGRLPGRLPWEVESGLYYAAVAALSAVPGAAGLEVTLAQAGDRASVAVTVPDDAAAVAAALTEDADRLAALGGALDVDDEVLRAWLPLQLSPTVEAR